MRFKDIIANELEILSIENERLDDLDEYGNPDPEYSIKKDINDAKFELLTRILKIKKDGE